MQILSMVFLHVDEVFRRETFFEQRWHNVIITGLGSRGKSVIANNEAWWKMRRPSCLHRGRFSSVLSKQVAPTRSWRGQGDQRCKKARVQLAIDSFNGSCSALFLTNPPSYRPTMSAIASVSVRLTHWVKCREFGVTFGLAWHILAN